MCNAAALGVSASALPNHVLFWREEFLSQPLSLAALLKSTEIGESIDFFHAEIWLQGLDKDRNLLGAYVIYAKSHELCWMTVESVAMLLWS